MSIDSVQPVVSIPSSTNPSVRPPEKTKEVPTKVESTPARLPQARAVQVNASFGSGLLVIYRFVDKDTGQLIQQIPPDQFLKAEQDTQEPSLAAASSQKLNLKF